MPGGTPRGTLPVWACALLTTLQVVVGAGFEPATLDIQSRCSTHLSYPVVDEPDSNRWPTARAAALTLSYRPLAKHRLPLPGMRHGKAARTGRMRPSSRESAPLWSVRRCFALAPFDSANSFCECPHATRAEASRHGANAPLADTPASDQHVRMLRGAMHSRLIVGGSLANAGNKKPPGFQDPRAFARLGRSGRPISRAVGSVERGEALVRRFEAHQAARGHAMVDRPRRSWVGDVEAGLHGKTALGTNAVSAKGAHVTRAFS